MPLKGGQNGAMYVNLQPTQLNLLGLPLHKVDMAYALDHIESFLYSDSSHMVVTLNSEMVVMAQRDLELKEAIINADVVVPDSVGILWACGFLGHPLPERVAGADLVYALLEKGASKGWRFFFLGGRPGVAEIAAEEISRDFPGIQVVGWHHGFFESIEEGEVISSINSARPHILLVGMGVPKQEKWIASHIHDLRDLHVPISIGVGGTIDLLAGKAQRAPLWIRNLSLEWLYRILRQPQRFIRACALPRFVFLVLRFKVEDGAKDE